MTSNPYWLKYQFPYYQSYDNILKQIFKVRKKPSNIFHKLNNIFKNCRFFLHRINRYLRVVINLKFGTSYHNDRYNCLSNSFTLVYVFSDTLFWNIKEIQGKHDRTRTSTNNRDTKFQLSTIWVTLLMVLLCSLFYLFIFTYFPHFS